MIAARAGALAVLLLAPLRLAPGARVLPRRPSGAWLLSRNETPAAASAAGAPTVDLTNFWLEDDEEPVAHIMRRERVYKCCCGPDASGEDIFCKLTDMTGARFVLMRGCAGRHGWRYTSWNKVSEVYGDRFPSAGKCLVSEKDSYLKHFLDVKSAPPPPNKDYSGWKVQIRELSQAHFIGCEGLVGQWEEHTDGEKRYHVIFRADEQGSPHTIKLKESKLEAQMLIPQVPAPELNTAVCKKLGRHLAAASAPPVDHGGARVVTISGSLVGVTFKEGDPEVDWHGIFGLTSPFWDFEAGCVLHQVGPRWVVSRATYMNVQDAKDYGAKKMVSLSYTDGRLEDPRAQWVELKHRQAPRPLHLSEWRATVGKPKVSVAFVTADDVSRFWVVEAVQKARENYQLLDTYRFFKPFQDDVTEIKKDSPPRDLRVAYMQLARKLHPDRGARSQRELDAFVRIKAAAERLGVAGSG